MATHFVLRTRHLCPSTHHEGVVGGKHDDDVDAFGLELVVLLKIGREMLLVACALRVESQDFMPTLLRVAIILLDMDAGKVNLGR